MTTTFFIGLTIEKEKRKELLKIVEEEK